MFFLTLNSSNPGLTSFYLIFGLLLETTFRSCMVYGECFGHDFMVLHHMWCLLRMWGLLSLTQWAVVSLSYSPVSRLLPWNHLDDEEFLCALSCLVWCSCCMASSPWFYKTCRLFCSSYMIVLLRLHTSIAFFVLSCYRVSLQNLLSLLLSWVLKKPVQKF